MCSDLTNINGYILDNKHYYLLRIFYEDTDAGQIIYHSNYLKFFERARSSLLNLLNIDQVNMQEKNGVSLVVRKVNIIWHKPAKLNDCIIIETCLKYAKNSSITLCQNAFKFKHNKNNNLLVSGIVEIVAINSEFKVLRIGKIINDAFYQNKY